MFEINQTKSKTRCDSRIYISMPRGGNRSGAGRKKGSLNLKTRVIAERAAAEGVTPLEVMLRTMRSAWARASSNGEAVTNFKEALIAAAMAEKAAPYVHPRLAAQKHEVKGDGKPSFNPTPQVIIYLPDNGRDPDLVRPVPDPGGANGAATR
jgi:hypothetical protein